MEWIKYDQYLGNEGGCRMMSDDHVANAVVAVFGGFGRFGISVFAANLLFWW